eukprot:361616-Chlamydomonas_euryale.AAC.22
MVAGRRLYPSQMMVHEFVWRPHALVARLLPCAVDEVAVQLLVCLAVQHGCRADACDGCHPQNLSLIHLMFLSSPQSSL